jgi:hypothetical protein
MMSLVQNIDIELSAFFENVSGLKFIIFDLNFLKKKSRIIFRRYLSKGHLTEVLRKNRKENNNQKQISLTNYQIKYIKTDFNPN